MKPVHILLIEDNAGDILLTTEALSNSKIANRVSVIKDGKEAIDYFDGLGGAKDAPDLVLLDINLPKRNGHEVLQYIKTIETFKHIPVIMLTTSSAGQDIIAAYKNYVNCFITKPVDVTDFQNAVTRLEDFWTKIVSLPRA